MCPAHAQFPGQSTSRKLNQSPRRNEFTYFSTLIGYHRGAGVWLFDPGTPGVSRERGRDPPGPRATRHWSSLISLGHEFWEVGCPWTKMVAHPPSKTRSFRIEGGRGTMRKSHLSAAPREETFDWNRFRGHVRECARSGMGSSMMYAGSDREYLKMIHVVDIKGWRDRVKIWIFERFCVFNKICIPK